MQGSHVDPFGRIVNELSTKLENMPDHRVLLLKNASGRQRYYIHEGEILPIRYLKTKKEIPFLKISEYAILALQNGKKVIGHEGVLVPPGYTGSLKPPQLPPGYTDSKPPQLRSLYPINSKPSQLPAGYRGNPNTPQLRSGRLSNLKSFKSLNLPPVYPQVGKGVQTRRVRRTKSRTKTKTRTRTRT